MAAVLTIINDALQEIGVYGAGETVSGDDVAVCLSALNGLLDAWRLENLYIYAQQDITHTLPANTASVTIGDGSDIDLGTGVNRPIRFEAGSFVRVGGLDYPLECVSQAEFNDITLKTINGPWPCVFTYEATYPEGTLTFWPQGACELHLNAQIPLPQFTASTNTFSMPPGYKRALSLTLAEEIAPKFQRQPGPAMMKKAANARRIIKRANLVVPQLDVGARMTLPGRYAILAG